jgi:hypothetical protein
VPCLALSRVVALVGGLALVGAFFMPWFSSQNLLLSGQFLHIFLGSPGDVRRFLPTTSAGEAQVLRVLVDLFPVCGGLAVLAALVGGFGRPRWRLPTDVLLLISGLLPLAGWAGGITRLPPGSGAEIGLGLMPLGALGVLAGGAADLVWGRARP